MRLAPVRSLIVLFLVALVVAGPGHDEPIGPLEVERAFPDVVFQNPILLTHAGDGSERLFVVEQRGIVWTFVSTEPESASYLDITDRVSTDGREEGLLGLAFDPEFATNGHLYVYYSASGPRRSVISRYTVAAGRLPDARSELVLLEIAQPYGNHNGGMIGFGPDGFLYVGVGDGGSGNDPHRNGQNTGTLLGSILRIDVAGVTTDEPYRTPGDNPLVEDSGSRPEIWAYGLRNPWRFSFDSATGDLWVADVGQSDFEEVNLVHRGGNYGWNTMEGSHCFLREDCDPSGFELPVAEYDHGLGCSVTGGYVYRGEAVPSLSGVYVYADFCSGRIWGLRQEGGLVGKPVQLADVAFEIPSFGVDEQGELYILGFDGRIYRFAAEDPGPLPTPTSTRLPTATSPPDLPPVPTLPVPTPLPVAPPTEDVAESRPSPAQPALTPTPTPTTTPIPVPSGETSAAVWGMVIFVALGAAAATLFFMARRRDAGASG